VIRVERFSDARSFVTSAREFLLSREAHHNLILGILWTLTHQPEQFEHTPYLAQVLEERRVVAAAVMTPPKNLVLSLAPDEAALRLIAEDLFTDRTDLPGVLGPEAESEAFARCWGLISGQSVRQGMAQLIHQLEAVTPISEASGELRRATGQERDLLVQWMNEFTGEALNERDPGRAERAVDMHLKRKSLYLWWHGRPVSMAGWAGPTANGIRVTAVYTPPEFRRRGYAGACVAALSQSLLDGGYRYCFLFTDKSNPTSNHIYRDIGYRPVCDVAEYRFGPRP
jgi:predicted GNAT family acetyltransferase